MLKRLKQSEQQFRLVWAPRRRLQQEEEVRQQRLVGLMEVVGLAPLVGQYVIGAEGQKEGDGGRVEGRAGSREGGGERIAVGR